jgi:hypothetical protein
MCDYVGRANAEDARVERGPAIVFTAQAAVARGAVARVARACSFVVPVCASARSGARVMALLDAAERVWPRLMTVLELPRPILSTRDGARAPALELEESDSARVEPRLQDRVAWATFDAAALRLEVPGGIAPGCSLDAQVGHALALASAARSAPGLDPRSRDAQAAVLSELASGCILHRTLEAQDESARHPESSVIVGNDLAPQTLHGALFYRWLDAHYGKGPGRLLPLLWAFGPTQTPTGAAHWYNEPDSIDVLRESLKDARFTGSRLEDVWIDFAVDRLFFGRDELRFPETRSAPPAWAWEIPWPEKPRRLLSPHAVAPLGASYVLIDKRQAAAGSRLRLEAEWELEARLKWIVVKLDAQLRELGRIVVGSPERVTEAQMSVAELDRTAYIAIVAVNLGNPKFPLDPDDEVREPHGWLLTVAAE